MIKLFRKIRRKLLDERKLRRYLIYAFGEIILVVAGILIAVQLNNLNENRKIRTVEVQILKDLIIGIEDDIQSIHYNIELHSEAINSCNVLLNNFSKNTGYNDSLSHHFAAIHYYTLFMNNKGAFESLKSKGFKTISNKKLRFSIINLYEKWYPIVQKNDNDLANDILHIKRNFNQAHFDKFQLFEATTKGFVYQGKIIPNNINKLQDNAEFKYFLNSLLASHSAVLSLYKFINDIADKAIEESKAEVQKLT